MNRVLVSGHASMFPTEHGGAKSVRHVMEALVNAGIECRMLIKMHPDIPERLRFGGQHKEGLVATLDQLQDYKPGTGGADTTWTCKGVKYRGVPGESADLARATRKEIEAYDPDAVLVCNDSLDHGVELFAVAADSGKMVFRCQTIHSLPFGPFSMMPNAAVTASLKKAMKIIVPSRHVGQYIEEHLGKPTMVYYPDVFGRPPFPSLGKYENPYVTMINPCPWKGGSIFMGLARSRPDIKFAAVPTWGATPDVLEQLARVPNITVLEETPKVDEIYAQTRVLIVPSICQEAFGLVSPEALLRGIPVIASDMAGLKESTLGAAPLIPVKPLPFDHAVEGTDVSRFVWNEPDNPIAPWTEALDQVLASKKVWEERSQKGRDTALAFIDQLAKRSIKTFFTS